jgi:hypothetical protein
MRDHLVGYPYLPGEVVESLYSVESRLGADRYAALIAQGEEMQDDEALAYAQNAVEEFSKDG